MGWSQYGFEIVCILFALLIAYGPDKVFLNRGNHEDVTLCRCYGFADECTNKYSSLIFEMCCEVFNRLPLFTLVNNRALIVHGGLFHTPEVTIDDLKEIDRTDYWIKPPIPYPDNLEGLNKEEQRQEFLKQLMREALWSDPTTEEGIYVSERGAGVQFGPDIADAFMKHNNIDMVIRSHECVPYGFKLPYEDDMFDYTKQKLILIYLYFARYFRLHSTYTPIMTELTCSFVCTITPIRIK